MVQRRGSDQRGYTVLLCHVRNICNNWMVVTSVWTTVFTSAPADISLVWYHWLKKQFSLFQETVQKKFCWNAEIWVATQYVCCGSWKICFSRKPAVTKTIFYNIFAWSSVLLMLKAMILWQLCSHFFQLEHCDIQEKNRMCRSQNLSLSFQLVLIFFSQE